VSIEDVAQELYALAPEDFTAARNARAKEAKSAGDAALATQVQALRKPTAGAWLLNQFVRAHADEVQQVLDLGAQLRAAQGSLGAAELRQLDQQRRKLTRAVAQQVRKSGLDAGRRVTDAVTNDVEETLRSAMVDEAAGQALLTGLLVDTFSSTGLEPVDLSRVVAVPSTTPGAPTTRPGATASEKVAEVARPDPEHERRVAEALEALAGAEHDLAAAAEAAEQAAVLARSAREERESLEQERDEARRVLRDTEKRLAACAEQEEATTTARDKAAELRESATEAAERLRRRLERLRSG
jgi:hypothetical protein